MGCGFTGGREEVSPLPRAVIANDCNVGLLEDNVKRYIPFDFPKTRGLDVDNRGFFNGDWLSRSFSVSALKKVTLNKLFHLNPNCQ